MHNSSDRYKSESYLQANPSWHVEDAPWKAAHITRLLSAHSISPTSIVEAGCGSGQILKVLSALLPKCEILDGYDISEHALSIARSSGTTARQINFHVGDIDSISKQYEVGLAIDVIEHIEDCFHFVRQFKKVCKFKIYHIPLDISVWGVMRPNALLNTRRNTGHIHSFTREIALELLLETGHTVHGYFFTNGAADLHATNFGRIAARLPRKLLHSANPALCARWLGGSSLMVLAE